MHGVEESSASHRVYSSGLLSNPDSARYMPSDFVLEDVGSRRGWQKAVESEALGR